MRKLILTNYQAPGDILMLTAAVRDLHVSNPGQFLTDVRTSAGQLWEGNPWITPLDDSALDIEIVDCRYPLINSSNHNGRHFVTAFQDFLSDTLGVSIDVHAFQGDIHLSEAEKMIHHLWSEAQESGKDLWVVAAGGKFDFTCKWWPATHFQELVDTLADEVRFVQVGVPHHFHPKLDGVVNLVGKTSIRELIRLVYWSSGVLCPVTFLMHLTAAVPVNPLVRNTLRPCVVLAGGREPQNWEAYPGHQYLHTVGRLDCCAFGGCWKSRVSPLQDGADVHAGLCERPTDGYAACMEMITSAQVAGSIRGYASTIGFSPRPSRSGTLRARFFSDPAHRGLLRTMGSEMQGGDVD